MERDIFKDRLTEEELRSIAALASVDEMFSWASPSARQYRERRGQLADDELISLMADEPRLIRRPILILDGDAIFGFRVADYEAALER